MRIKALLAYVVNLDWGMSLIYSLYPFFLLYEIYDYNTTRNTSKDTSLQVEVHTDKLALYLKKVCSFYVTFSFESGIAFVTI